MTSTSHSYKKIFELWLWPWLVTYFKEKNDLGPGTYLCSTNTSCLLLELTLLLVFEFDFLSLFCNTNTLPNILMVLGTNVEQDVLTCCIQDDRWWDCRGWGGGIFVFFSKKPFPVISSFWHALDKCKAISVYVCIVTDTYIYLPPVCGFMFSWRITKEK